MIKTDGVGVSILFMKIQKNCTPYNKVPKALQKQVKNAESTPYIEEIQLTKEIKQKKIVVLDPGYSDLFYALSDKPLSETIIKDKQGNIINHTYHNTSEFRYTNAQRRQEIGIKKYSKITEDIKTKTKIKDKTVKELEAELSKFNSKTCEYKEFLNYCKKKNSINKLLFNHYAQNMYRKFKFNMYTNTQRSESKMINNFKSKFGNPEEVLVIIGDYDKKENMRGKEPAICKRIRKIFQMNGYKVYLINEFRTSKLCNRCCHETENYLERESKNPKYKGKKMLVWGLTRCKNVKCKSIHNRDVNACKNMLKIVKSIFAGKGRPKKYCRELNLVLLPKG
jgi:hypothetical protein